MPEISRFYGLVVKMFFKPRSMSHRIFTSFMVNSMVFLKFNLNS